MLKKAYRLTKTTDFELVKTKGIKRYTPYFALGIHNRNDTLPSRFGIITSSKVFSRAVDRNRAKRLLSEALKELAPNLVGQDLVFIVRPPLLTLPFKEIEAEIIKIIK